MDIRGYVQSGAAAVEWTNIIGTGAFAEGMSGELVVRCDTDTRIAVGITDPAADPIAGAPVLAGKACKILLGSTPHMIQTIWVQTPATQATIMVEVDDQGVDVVFPAGQTIEIAASAHLQHAADQAVAVINTPQVVAFDTQAAVPVHITHSTTVDNDIIELEHTGRYTFALTCNVDNLAGNNRLSIWLEHSLDGGSTWVKPHVNSAATVLLAPNTAQNLVLADTHDCTLVGELIRFYLQGTSVNTKLDFIAAAGSVPGVSSAALNITWVGPLAA